MNNPILARFQNEPTLVSPDKHRWFESCIAGAADAIAAIPERPVTASADADSFWGDASDSWAARYRPYVVSEGVLQIPVKGVLLNNFPYALGDWATGYEYIWKAFERGMGDENVRGIALVVDSPGGMVSGCFEMADKMFAMRGRKPIAGFASESAYSAAYATISVADPGSIYVTRTGGVGSIGVVTSHVDVSKAMGAQGVKVTFIHAGAHKVDGNPYEALPADVQARIQARIDDLYSVFVSSVARNRGLDEQAIRDTEALTFGASDALSNGLADKVGALDDSLADFAASLTPNNGDAVMADITQADLDTALATATANHETALATARAEAATAERERISAILDSEEAADRPAAARMLAFDTDKAPEAAVASLAKLPAEAKAAAPAAVEPNPTAGAPKGMFTAAMDGSQNPDISDASPDDDNAANPGQGDVALARSFGLGGLRPAERQ